MQSKFKLIARGFKNTIVLIPGWAADYRIFSILDLKKYNYLLPVEFCPFSFKKDLSHLLNGEFLDKISLFGYSLGGFVAADFALKYPERIDELVLLGIRKKFDSLLLKEIEGKLKKNKSAYLYKFYLDCFSRNDKEGRTWFKKHLLPDYLDKMELEGLIKGLDYLSAAQINPESLAGIEKLRIFHGGEDRIAPLEEARDIKSYLPQAKFICIPGAGHISFLNLQFKDKFNEIAEKS